MASVLTVAIPTVCYAAAAWIFIAQRDYGRALMFAGYAVANVGIILPLVGVTNGR